MINTLIQISDEKVNACAEFTTESTDVIREVHYALAQVEFEAREEKESSPYQELIYAVGTVYPNETRHQTALRYITEQENKPSQVAQEIKDK